MERVPRGCPLAQEILLEGAVFLQCPVDSPQGPVALGILGTLYTEGNYTSRPEEEGSVAEPFEGPGSRLQSLRRRGFESHSCQLVETPPLFPTGFKKKKKKKSRWNSLSAPRLRGIRNSIWQRTALQWTGSVPRWSAPVSTASEVGSVLPRWRWSRREGNGVDALPPRTSVTRWR